MKRDDDGFRDDVVSLVVLAAALVFVGMFVEAARVDRTGVLIVSGLVGFVVARVTRWAFDRSGVK